MKLISSQGTRAIPKAHSLPEIRLPKLQLPRQISRSQAMVATAVFTLLTSLVLFVPVLSPAKAADAPDPTPSPVIEQAAEPAPEQMDEAQRLAVGIYTVIHGRSVSPTTAQMVGEVVLNRVQSNLFPATLDAVLMQPYQFGELSHGYSWSAIAEGGSPDVALAYSAAQLVLDDAPRLLPTDTLYVSDTEQGQLAAMMDGLYFGR